MKQTKSISSASSPKFSPGMKAIFDQNNCMFQKCISELQHIYKVHTLLIEQQNAFDDLQKFKIDLGTFNQKYKSIQKQFTKEDVNHLRNLDSLSLFQEYGNKVIKCAIQNCSSELKTWLLYQIDDLIKHTPKTKRNVFWHKKIQDSKREIQTRMTVNNVSNFIFYILRILNPIQIQNFFHLNK